MQTVRRVVIGIFIVLSFAAGLSLRWQSDQRMMAAFKEPVTAQGPRVAATELPGATNVDFQPLQTLYLVLTRVREYYVEQLTPKNEGDMTYDALKAMLASLNDVNTRFIEPEEVKAINDAQAGKFHGIGAMLGVKKIANGGVADEHLVVVSPIIGGSAYAAKLQPGDIIEAIDGKTILPFNPFLRVNKMLKSTKFTQAPLTERKKTLETEQKRIENGTTIIETEKMLTSEDGKSVELTIRRPGSPKTLKVKLERQEFTIEPVISKMGANDIAYVRINCLCDNTAEQLGKTIETLQGEGAKGMVLDIRNAAGGEIADLKGVTCHLMPGKTIGMLAMSRGRKSAINSPAAPAQGEWKGPLVVMIGSGTARTPELLAAALKDQNRAKLIGSATNGDSAFASVSGLKDGSAVMMTAGKLLTDKNQDFTGKGIMADAPLTSGASDEAQFSEASKLLAIGERN